MGAEGSRVSRSRGRPTANQGAPHGPDDVRAALLEAATELFAERGIGRVSVREVAATAGVNVGLVHRYVGTKAELVGATVRWAATHASGGDGDAPTLGAYERLLAHLSLEGYDVAALDLDFPLTRQLVDTLVDGGVDDREARLRAVCNLTLSAWPLLRPMVSLATQLDGDDQQAVDAAMAATRAWLGSPS
jgi:TetR/AcrR family transcriptional regulator, repressor for neighboring sulfatase